MGSNYRGAEHTLSHCRLVYRTGVCMWSLFVVHGGLEVYGGEQVVHLSWLAFNHSPQFLVEPA